MVQYKQSFSLYGKILGMLEQSEDKLENKAENASNGSVQSIDRALDLLECLARSPNWMGISELSSATGQPVGTVHRLLMTLMAREYVARDSRTRRYALGPAFRLLAGAALRTPNWGEIAAPYLREMVEMSGETANLAVLERDRAVYVAQAQPVRMVRMFTEIGNRVPLYNTGCGKVLLAYQPEYMRSSYLSGTGLVPYTKTTITDPELLKQALEQIRQNGYAIDDEEQEEGVRCLSVPVYGMADKVIAAISISGPSSRLDSERIATLIPQVKRVSASLAIALQAAQDGTSQA